MPNDAKLGLVLGVGLVITVAVVFFRKEPEAAPAAQGAGATINPGANAPPAATDSPPPTIPAPPVTEDKPAPPAKTTSALRTADLRVVEPAGRRHTVQKGDTLFTLAQHYYGDGDRFVDLYRANRGHLRTPDNLEPGTVLIVPEPDK